MAKGTTGKAFKQDIKQALPEQQEILRDLGKQKAEVEKIKQSYDKLNDSLRNTTANSSAHYKVQQKLNDLLRQYDGDVKNLLDNLQDVNGAFEEQKKKVKSLKSELTDYIDSFGELEGLQSSITNEYGRQSVQAKSLEAIVDKTKAQYNGITSILNNNTDIQGHQRDVIMEALDTYKNFPVVLNGMEKQLKRGQISAEGFQETIIKTEQGFQDLLNQMDEMIPGVKEIKTLLEELPGIMKKSAAAAAAMKKQFENIDAASEVAGFFGGGVAGGSGLITNIAQGAKDKLSGQNLKTMTMVGGVIAAAELNAQMLGTGLAAADAANTMATAKLENALTQRKIQISLANAIPEKQAMIEFKYQLEGLTNEFEKSSKTALFGAALGEMPYATDQMQLAGIGAESVTSALNDLSKTANIGIFPKLAANAAVFAKKMGISTSELGTQIGLYRQLNRVGGAQAMTGVQSSITSGVIDPTTFSADMADASKLAMIYNIKSYQALSKQVKSLRMMGVSFAEIAEDGKNMVLNYKDSIKSEMQLSAMLGENVDLSEVRALIAANDIEGAQRAFNATGLAEKARAQGLFTTDMLQKTVGSSIQMGGLAAKYQPGQKVNAPSNAAFLDTFKDAEATFNIKSAILQVKQMGEMSELDLAKLILEKTDTVAQQIEAQKYTQDAINFIRTQGAKASELINTMFLSKITGIENRPIGTAPVTDNVKNAPITPSNKSIDYKSTKNSSITPPITKGVDYISRMPDKQQEVINLGKQTQKVQSKITTSAESQTNSSNYLKNIDTQSTLQTQLLQNIQALTAAASRFNELKFGDMKLMLDGKEVKSRIEKISTQQKPISR
jgi:hypothetical protein